MEVNSYFESYEDLQVHKLMLNDVARNKAYKKAIFDNKDKLQGKIVLDVGAGTGILSVLCAQAGAAKVYAVEASDVYKIAEKIVDENRFRHIIKVIHGKIEEVNLPEQVDVIISEWMGFYLLHEGMLDSVIIARDRYLKSSGLMFPESATLFSAPCSVPSMFDDWNNITGVSMTTFGELLRKEASEKPITITISPDDIIAEPEVVTWIDLREVTIQDLDAIKVRHVSVAHKSAKYQGISLWFVCAFPAALSEPVILSTDPEEPITHWKQTVIVLPNEVEVEKSEPIAYEICLNRNLNNKRQYNIEMTMLDPDTVQHPEYCKCYMTKCMLLAAVLEKYETDSLAQ